MKANISKWLTKYWVASQQALSLRSSAGPMYFMKAHLDGWIQVCSIAHFQDMV
jgi:hypothetical protein